ncbi:MAG TPA: hypothetical protein P5346_15535 [Spirochaetota bacterium]|nr:hypothetical protein [Spirochaetota bacterium]
MLTVSTTAAAVGYPEAHFNPEEDFLSESSSHESKNKDNINTVHGIRKLAVLFILDLLEKIVTLYISYGQTEVGCLDASGTA